MPTAYLYSLADCPFCGSEHVVVKLRKTAIVECTFCGALIIRKIAEDAILAWNTRYPKRKPHYAIRIETPGSQKEISQQEKGRGSESS